MRSGRGSPEPRPDRTDRKRRGWDGCRRAAAPRRCRPRNTRDRTMHLKKAPAIGIAVLLAACNDHAEGKVTPGQPAAASGRGLADRPLQPWQAELLELGFQCASALPMEPHRKDRANAQE